MFPIPTNSCRLNSAMAAAAWRSCTHSRSCSILSPPSQLSASSHFRRRHPRSPRALTPERSSARSWVAKGGKPSRRRACCRRSMRSQPSLWFQRSPAAGHASATRLIDFGRAFLTSRSTPSSLEKSPAKRRLHKGNHCPDALIRKWPGGRRSRRSAYGFRRPPRPDRKRPGQPGQLQHRSPQILPFCDITSRRRASKRLPTTERSWTGQVNASLSPAGPGSSAPTFATRSPPAAPRSWLSTASCSAAAPTLAISTVPMWNSSAATSATSTSAPCARAPR